MFNELNPRQSSILLSEPFMLDEAFERSVVLLYEHSPMCTEGIILNQNSTLYLDYFIDEVENENIPLYTGGPEQDCAIYFIHRAFDKIQSGKHLFEDLYWGGDYDRLFDLFNQNLLSPQEVKVFVGHCRWEAGQLDQEIRQNSWAVNNSYHAELPLIEQGEELWKNILIDMGPKYAHVANFPKNPAYN